MPVLGICRGLQVINVARGGTLHQHLPDVVGHDGHAPAPGAFGSHAVRVEPGSRLSQILGRDGADLTITTPTHHHQAVDKLGSGLIATAWARGRHDRGVRARRTAADGPFLVAVQWHPEAGDDPQPVPRVGRGRARSRRRPRSRLTAPARRIAPSWDTMSHDRCAPGGCRSGKPTPARMYDYFLGGTSNFPADRELGDRLKALVPEIGDSAWANRSFHQRAARGWRSHGVTPVHRHRRRAAHPGQHARPGAAGHARRSRGVRGQRPDGAGARHRAARRVREHEDHHGRPPRSRGRAEPPGPARADRPRRAHRPADDRR